jgi:hypothetical protein
MNFLIQTFTPLFNNYISTFTASEETQKPLTYFEFVRNELRKKNIHIFSNETEGTILARFKGEREKTDMSDPVIINNRSSVYDFETHETLLIGPPKSVEFEAFKAAHPTFDGVTVEDFPAGPMINVFHHPTKGWKISTRSYVGGNNTFRSGTKSFRALFEEALLKTTGLTIENFGDKFDKENTFSFVLTHPDYFDVTRYVEPSLVLVEVRDRSNNHIRTDLSGVNGYTDSLGFTIKYPQYRNFNSWEMVENYIKTQPSQEQGLVFRYQEERSKLRNPEYVRAQKLLGNHTKLIDIFAENLQNQTVNDFLEVFPEKMKEFNHFMEIHRRLVHDTHSFYIAHHTRPVGQKIEFSEIPRPVQTAVWNIHKQYIESGTDRESRRQVKPIVVENYFKNLTSVDLANVLTYWDNYLATLEPVKPKTPHKTFHHNHTGKNYQHRQYQGRHHRGPTQGQVQGQVPVPEPVPAPTQENETA